METYYKKIIQENERKGKEMKKELNGEFAMVSGI